ncbi:MAG TPA: transketolase C-terminal domain-containing protein, partial [Candidatus Thalassarchaeaceae archaeon]|nr:transketolase C-terminal domain-containing protein [Candidatus Thalassarchaeaceae archaeon]
YYNIPLGQARVAIEGSDCTVIAWGTMVHVCEKGIKESGVSCDLIDLQTLVPWDREAVVNSIQKTGRCVIVHEAPKTSGFGAEMSASIQERCFYNLESPIERVTGWDTPFPHTTEWDYMPGPSRIAKAILRTQEE